MSKKTKTQTVVEQPKSVEQPKQETKIDSHDENHVQESFFPREILVKSKSLESFGLHKDIISAILTNDSYTLSEAKNVIQKYIDSFNV